MKRLMVLVVVVLLLTPSTVSAAIKELPSSDWTPQEKWVWDQVSQGEIADFNKADGYGGKLDPKKIECWQENRILRPEFLETILFQEHYRNALTHRGVCIVGAWFREALDLSSATIPFQLRLDGSHFELDVDLSYLKAPILFLEGSFFVGSFNLSMAKIEIINMSGSTFNGTLNMNSLEVGSHLLMGKEAQFAAVDLVVAKINEVLDMSGSTFNGTLDMDGLEVGSHLVMGEEAQFAAVNLIGAKVGGQLDMRSSTFNGTLDMDGLEVGSHLFMRNTSVEKPITLIFATIRGFFDISGAELSSLDLTGTKVVQELRLGSGSHPAVKWKDNSQLNLRNSEVGSLQDIRESWSDTLKLELDGFVYHRLGGLSGAETTDMDRREISWLKEWLGKQDDYSPKPYQQMAKVLRNAGYVGKATAVLFEGKKRQQEETRTLSIDWWWLVIQWLFIGYGYYNFQVLYWFSVVCGLGMLVLHLSGQDAAHKMKYYGLSYSIDTLLPIIELHRPHYDIELQGWVRVYFYVHKVFGYVLASFLIAGLSGLTRL